MGHTVTALFLIILVFIGCPAFAQRDLPVPIQAHLSADQTTLIHGHPLRAVVNDPHPPRELRHIPAPEKLTVAPDAATTNFVITYVENGGADLWGEECFTFPEEAKTAFVAAANIWANTVNSTVPITIRACWAQLGSSSTLGYSGGGYLQRDFPGATRPNTWFTAALANALADSDLVSGDFDMHITYNSIFSWYYGVDGNTPVDKHDLMTVVLHEIAHGLNFSGSMSSTSGTGNWGYGTGYPNIYDTLMRDGTGQSLIDTAVYPNPSTALGTALTSNSIWFHGAQAVAANAGTRVKMYAPAIWAGGSSYSHLDYTSFNNTANQLMVYAISAGESIHDPGAITTGLLQDLGWPVSIAATHTLTVNSDGAASVPISATPALYAGTTNYQIPDIPSGTTLTLTAPGSADGLSFSSWSGCDSSSSTTCTLSMLSGKTVTAQYVSPPIQLVNNVPVTNLVGNQDDLLHYYIMVPSGASSLQIQTWGGDGDADLYVRYGAPPTTDLYDYRPWLYGNDEEVTISNPQAGNWYIGIHGYEAFSGVSLQARYVQFPWSLFFPIIIKKP